MKPKKGFRFVRVDNKTVIEVSSSISNEKAIDEYLAKLAWHKRNQNKKGKL